MAPVFIAAKLSPTTSETTALAALVPATVAPSKSTTDVLEEVLSLCQNPDVVSFLFTDDKIQLPYLTSPLLFKTAVTGTMKSTRVEPDSSRACAIGPLSDLVTGKWVFVPTFSVSGVSLGFGMHEFNYNQGDCWDGDFSMYMRAEFRFVRNEAKGEMLVLHDISDMNACCMEYVRTVTPTCQSRTSICLYRDKLREVAKSGFIDRVKILPALDQINTIYEYRDCPKCHLGHTACRCTLQLARARHPFDHSTFVKNMTQRLGTFEGVASVFCYDGGMFKRKSALGCRTTMRGGIDTQLISSMRDWAVGLHMKGTESPLQTIVAPTYEDSNETTVPSTEETEEIDFSLGQAIEPDALWLGDGNVFGALPSLESMEGDLFDLSNIGAKDDWISDSELRADTGIQIEELNGQTAEIRKDAQPLIDLMGTAAMSSARSSNGISGNGKDVDLVKMLKQEMRRKRNREAAHRSNMKKKAANDKLKHELKTNKEKADTLRMQESELRQENIRLRRMLAESPS